jgi:peptide-methionine (S)-S-oxide reductase
VTGHAEVIRIEFDSAQITYEQILDIFFEVHDPTTLNQQGADVGTQYRSIILTTSKEQENTAKAKISSLVTAKKFGTRRITTEIIPLDQFFIAEGYHHNYFKRFQDAPYCQVIIDPKVQQFITKHPTLTKS